jgi:hypothetical protein
MHVFHLFCRGLAHLRRSTLERVLGVDWHGLAMELPQIYPKKFAGNLRHIPACVGVL